MYPNILRLSMFMGLREGQWTLPVSFCLRSTNRVNLRAREHADSQNIWIHPRSHDGHVMSDRTFGYYIVPMRKKAKPKLSPLQAGRPLRPGKRTQHRSASEYFRVDLCFRDTQLPTASSKQKMPAAEPACQGAESAKQSLEGLGPEMLPSQTGRTKNDEGTNGNWRLCRFPLPAAADGNHSAGCSFEICIVLRISP